MKVKFGTYWALSLLLTGNAFAENSLTIHLIRSPGLNWSTPRSIAKSTISNALNGKSWPIGHMTVEIRCGERSVKSGMTQKYGDEDNRVVKKEKQGLGVLFHTFVGKHQDARAVDRSMLGMIQSGRFGVVKFLVSPESCERMLAFQETFVATGMYKNYGLLSRPLAGEGGGCAAYAMAYPAVGGFLEPWMLEQWSQYRRVPRGSVGGPLTGYSIGWLRTMTGGPTRWARDEEAGFPLFFYDPDKIFDWAKNVYAGASATGVENAGAIRRLPVTKSLLNVPLLGRNTAFAIEIDRREVKPPVAANYSPVQRDPHVIFERPELLNSWWTDEISINRAYHQKRGPVTNAEDPAVGSVHRSR